MVTSFRKIATLVISKKTPVQACPMTLESWQKQDTAEDEFTLLNIEFPMPNEL